MSSVRRIINYIKNLNGKLHGDVFDTSITKLRELESGLTNDDIKSLLSILIDNKFNRCRASGFKDLLYCCIPEICISSDDVDAALLWMLSVKNDESVIPSKINAILEWVSGLLEYNLVKKADVDGYYEMYYVLLQRQACQRQACKLIHMLTRPDDVYRGRVEKILLLYKKSGFKAKHLAHLLELFKTFKPELVPENIKSYSRASVFKSLPPGFTRSLEAAQQRLQAQNILSSTKSTTLDWTAVTWKKNKTGMSLIPSAMYVHLGSELYWEKRRKIVDFLDKISLASYHLNSEIPTSILSLMLNEGGIHFLSTHNSDVHARFSSVLYSCLYSVFIQNNKHVPYEERDHFLQQLVLLEDYMQQGIPIVSRFLAFYISSWNGLDHQKHIYQLLERITLVNFEEFNDCILTHLQTLFLAGDTDEKNLIIKSLSQLIYNMYIKQCKQQLPKDHLFLGGKYECKTDCITIVSELNQVVTSFCELGLLVTSNHPSVLHVSLCFFETLADMQLEAKLDVTIIPPTLFYRCLFSLDFNSVARVCGLLLRYKEVFEHASGSQSFHQVQLLNKYSCDVWNCLVNRQAFSKAEQGYILDKHDRLKQIITVSPDSAFTLEHHPTMLGLAQHFQSLEMTTDFVLSDQVLNDALAVSFPEFSKCLEALKSKYVEYHSSTS